MENLEMVMEKSWKNILSSLWEPWCMYLVPMQDLLSDIGPILCRRDSPFNDFSGKSRLLGSPNITYLYPVDADHITFYNFI